MKKEIEEKIIEVEKNKRIKVYREWNGREWFWYVEPQALIAWFFFVKSWGPNDWKVSSSSSLVKISGYYSLEEAERAANSLKENYLK